jgi:hypothetical protein
MGCARMDRRWYVSKGVDMCVIVTADEVARVVSDTMTIWTDVMCVCMVVDV